MKPPPRLPVGFGIPFVLALTCLSLAGCATAIRYTYDRSLFRPKPFQYRAVVDVFEDARTKSERMGLSEEGTVEIYTTDHDFEPNVARQISEALAKHLNKARYFQMVSVDDVPDDIDLDPEKMKAWADKGIDIVIVGRIKHFYGYQTEPSPMGVAFGLIGAVTEMVANPKKVGGKTAYSPIKVVDLRNQRVVLNEEMEKSFDTTVTYYRGQAAYALDTLKEINHEFLRRLDTSLAETEQ